MRNFQKLELRIGFILQANPLPKARKPAYQLSIDFGPVGTLKSSAQITKFYQPNTLIGHAVVAVTNFPPKQIGHLISQALVTGFESIHERAIRLAIPKDQVPGLLGMRVGLLLEDGSFSASEGKEEKITFDTFVALNIKMGQVYGDSIDIGSEKVQLAHRPSSVGTGDRIIVYVLEKAFILGVMHINGSFIPLTVDHSEDVEIGEVLK